MALARETRTVAAARRRDAYQMLRAAIVLGDMRPQQRHAPSDGQVESPSAASRRLVALGGSVPNRTRLEGRGCLTTRHNLVAAMGEEQ
jgi:hypothetical protein